MGCMARVKWILINYYYYLLTLHTVAVSGPALSSDAKFSMAILWCILQASESLYAPERAAVGADPLMAAAVVASLEADLHHFVSGCRASEGQFPSKADYMRASNAVSLLSSEELAAGVTSRASAGLTLLTAVSDCAELFLLDAPEDWGLAEGAHARTLELALRQMGAVFRDSQPGRARSQQLMELLTRSAAAAISGLEEASGQVDGRELKMLETVNLMFMDDLDQKFFGTGAGDVPADDCKSALGALEGMVRVAAALPASLPSDRRGHGKNPCTLLEHYVKAIKMTGAPLGNLPDDALADEGLQRALISLVHSTAKLGARLVERAQEEADAGSMDLILQHKIDVWELIDKLVGAVIGRMGLAGDQGREIMLPSLHRYVY